MIREPSEYFRVQPSNIHGAGEGLFATRRIPPHTIFSVRHSDPVPRAMLPDITEQKEELLDLTVHANLEPLGPCVVDGKLSTLSSVLGYPYRPRVVVTERNVCVTMKANDLAWKAGISETEYLERCTRNKLEFIMQFEKKHAVGVLVYVTREIVSGEEVGSTYGYHYWE